jgi:hypothetical protein
MFRASVNLLQRRLNVRDFRSDEDVPGVKADELLAGVPEHPAGGGIGVKVPAFIVGEDHADLRVVEEGAEWWTS